MKNSAGSKRAAISFFLVLYIFYAATPLSIYGSDTVVARVIRQSSSGNIANIRLFIVELIMSVLSNDSDNEGPTVHFLLAKKKSLVPSQNGNSSFKSFAIVRNDAQSHGGQAISRLFSDAQSCSFSISLDFPTGLSPPSA